jgi:predicted GNAT superfamily acetyltransferase
VGVSVLLGNRYEDLNGHCKDLSEAGIGILLAAEMNVGEVVGLSFTIPGAEACEIRAVLRSRRGYHYGFEFLSLSAEQHHTLCVYLKSLAPID